MRRFAAWALFSMSVLVGCDEAPLRRGEPRDAGTAGAAGYAQADAGAAVPITTTPVDAGPSCAGLPTTCGPGSNESCCGNSFVLGGTYSRGYDFAGETGSKLRHATISSFRLDRFEVTVGRFRKFVAAWKTGWRPEYSSGKHVHLDSGWGLSDSHGPSLTPNEPGWGLTWSDRVAPTDTNLLCNAGYATWTPSPGANENRPINCVNWYEAYAFCIWDGGFLPSEAEWNYAATGGDELRSYAWVAPGTPATVDCAHANLFASPTCFVGGQNNVGSESPLGDGKFGQADLTGNVWEWVFDWFGTLATECDDCAVFPVDGDETGHEGVSHGGGFDTAPPDALVWLRKSDVAPSGRSNGNLGFRCARVP
jgi:formylglycine-generating enzyme required for sulfatase activity